MAAQRFIHISLGLREHNLLVVCHKYSWHKSLSTLWWLHCSEAKLCLSKHCSALYRACNLSIVAFETWSREHLSSDFIPVKSVSYVSPDWLPVETLRGKLHKCPVTIVAPSTWKEIHEWHRYCFQAKAILVFIGFPKDSFSMMSWTWTPCLIMVPGSVIIHTA